MTAATIGVACLLVGVWKPTSPALGSTTRTACAGLPIIVPPTLIPTSTGINASTQTTTATPSPTGTIVAISMTPQNSALAQLPLALVRPAATKGCDGNVYVFGQSSGTTVTTGSSFVFHPTTDSWTEVAPMPVSREGAQAVTFVDGRIAVMGGAIGCVAHDLCDEGTIYERLDIYDPSTNTWSTGAPMDTPRYRFAAGVVDGKIYVAGGSDGAGPLKSTEVYDIAANTWDTGPSLPLPVEGLSSAIDKDGALTVAGGFSYNSNHVRVLHARAFNLVNGDWKEIEGLARPIEDAAMTRAADGKLYLFGGYTQTWSSQVQVYDPATGKWGLDQNLLTPLCCTQAFGLADGRLLLVGGGQPASTNLAFYSPTTNQVYTGQWVDPFAPAQNASDHYGQGIQYDVTSVQDVAFEPASHELANHCDDCSTRVNLPFEYTLYGKSYRSAFVSSNGSLSFEAPRSTYILGQLPDKNFRTTIFAGFTDLCTSGEGKGIFTSVTGDAPNRVYTVEWRAIAYIGSCHPTNGIGDFELKLFEGQQQFDVLFKASRDNSTASLYNQTTGVQQASSDSYSAYLPAPIGYYQSTVFHFSLQGTDARPTETPTDVPTDTPTDTPDPSWTSTPTDLPTETPTS